MSSHPAVNCLVIPCHNEALRLDTTEISAFFSSTASVDLVMVDDGSMDQTWEILRRLEKTHYGRVHVVRLSDNCGKAEAVRAGVQAALTQGAYDCIGFCDADLATPLSEMMRLTEALHHEDADIVMGCRLLRLGAAIRRNAPRHYVGRIFATVVSLMLRVPVYDSQCGAKVFRTAIARDLFSEPFTSRWLFDVEVLARYLQAFGPQLALVKVIEVPLKSWVDRSGSKLRLRDFLVAPCQLWKIRRRYLVR